MNLRLKISDGASPKLKAAMRLLAGSELAELHHSAGVEVQKITRDHIAGLTRKSDSLSSKFGAPTTNFYGKAAVKVAASSALSADPSGATLTINHPGFIRAFRTVKIVPREAKALAIPIHAIAYGHRPGELWERLHLFVPRGKHLIAASIGGVLTPLYALCKSVTQKQDRSLLPTDAQFRDAAVDGATKCLTREMAKGGNL